LKTGAVDVEELLPNDLLRYRRDKLVIWIKELRKGSKDRDKPAAVRAAGQHADIAGKLARQHQNWSEPPK